MQDDRDLARLRAVIDGGFDQPGLLVRLDRLESSVRASTPRLDRLDRDLPPDHPLIDRGVARRVVEHIAAADATHKLLVGGAAIAARGTLTVVLSIAQVVILGWLVIHGVPVAH